MKLNKSNFFITIIVLLFAGAVILPTIASKDAEENQLSRRLEAFKNALPQEVRQNFESGNYDAVKSDLSRLVGKYKSYESSFTFDEKPAFLKAEYDALPAEKVEAIPANLREFYARYFKVLDFECIPAFTEEEVVDFFREYFVERLAELRS